MVKTILRFRWILIAVLAGGLAAVATADVNKSLPDQTQVGRARVEELNRTVHDRIQLAGQEGSGGYQTPAETLRRGQGSASDLVLPLLVVTKNNVGEEPRWAVVRFRGQTELRPVMAWGGRFFDPVLGRSFAREELASVVRTVGWSVAMDFPARYPSVQ